MRKHTNFGLQGALIAACFAGAIAIAGTTSAQRSGDWNRGSHAAFQSSATLILNGERICLGGRSIVHEIADAMRCKGYRVSVHDGCITVSYRGHAPRLSLTGCEYDIQVERSRGCIIIRPYVIHSRSHDHSGWGDTHGGYDRGHDRGSGHNRTWDRRSRSRWQPSHSSGLTIRIGSHCW